MSHQPEMSHRPRADKRRQGGCTGGTTYRHGDLGQFFANAVLHYTPEVKAIVGLVWNESPSPLLGDDIFAQNINVGLGGALKHLEKAEPHKFGQCHSFGIFHPPPTCTFRGVRAISHSEKYHWGHGWVAEGPLATASSSAEAQHQDTCLRPCIV